MSLNNTADSDPPTQPLVIPIYAPHKPASAIGRWLSDMTHMGQVKYRQTNGPRSDDGGSRTIVDKGNRPPGSPQTTADTDTTTSTDMERRVPDSSEVRLVDLPIAYRSRPRRICLIVLEMFLRMTMKERRLCSTPLGDRYAATLSAILDDCCDTRATCGGRG
ncbi:hypothetical protein BD309DRAFT_356133 [Dichomitus squalens]|uniref:Uncharacterized protein n=1 Tax=Dichomitus squalens TaxID=114155 RepID=A0A4Q9MMD6_9APHY|nr:hypothetical protein BD311DRAFT_376440 [Dichomitus squalens]TBU40283.1 hypothetical protein BD309DRAFT_356133 [Dichomitus squalens]